jgi:hypothetical protein
LSFLPSKSFLLSAIYLSKDKAFIIPSPSCQFHFLPWLA